MIPKIIHYCWFGNGEMKPEMKKCLSSWKKYCPDYKIICWNEKNFDINLCDYIREAYEAKKYAFVADFCRLFVLKKYGGFYFDTDIELLQSVERLRKYPAVSGFEEGSYLQTAFIGSEKDGEWVDYLFSYYHNRKFYKRDGSFDITTNVSTITNMTAEDFYLARNNKEQDLGVVHIFPKEVFSPKSFSTGIITKTANTICIHHFDSTWTGREAKKERMHRYKIFRIFGRKLGTKVLSFEEVTGQEGIMRAIIRIFMRRKKDYSQVSIILYGHTGSNNHGCEALARTIPRVLQNINVDLISTKPNVDIKYNVPVREVYQWKDSMQEFSAKWFIYKVCEKIFHNKKLMNFVDTNRKMLKIMKRYDGVFAIGGDNYCYNQGKLYHKIDSDIRKQHIKNGIIGCSMEPMDLEDILGHHIFNFGLVTARESITYEALLKAGHRNVFLIPDTAFLLPAQKMNFPNNWQEGNTIGINFSPLVLSCVENKEKTYNAMKDFIEYLLETTNCSIALISHVYKESGGDGELMEQLVGGLPQSRLIKIHNQKYNCMQIKWYISKCRLFIGARTHATIAAYSSCVPTIAIGYSVKSKGIAKDIFGTYKDYVLPIEEISNKDNLINSFNWLLSNEVTIKKHLQKNMPGYTQQVYKLKEVIYEYLYD